MCILVTIDTRTAKTKQQNVDLIIVKANWRTKERCYYWGYETVNKAIEIEYVLKWERW